MSLSPKMDLPFDLSLSTTKGTFGIVAVAITSIVWYIVSVATSWYRLRQFPGPTLAKFSYLWGYFAMRSGRINQILAGEHDKHGKIIRIGPNELCAYDPDTLWQINNVRSAYGRGDWYRSIKFDPYGHSILSESDTVEHDKRKAQLNGGYSGRGNVNLEQKVDSLLAVLIDILRNNYLKKDGRNIVDFGNLIRFFQIDLITLTGSGEPWGDLPTETDQFEFLETSDAYVPFLLSVMMMPLFRDFFASKFFLNLAGPKVTDEKGMGKFMGIIKKIVEKRFTDSPRKADGQGAMLDEWIKHGMTRRECELELAIQLPAGAETSTTAIRSIMLYVLSAPTVYQKLQEEIATGIRDGNISSPITQEEAKKLPYLQAVIHEGIRMVPPLITGFPKKVPAGGDVVCGKFVPGGTDIFVNFWNLLRNKEVFGEDADIFRPDRFLECDAGKKAQLIKNVDLAFGHGRFGCVGKTIAFLELNKIFVELLRNFDFQIVNPQTPWKIRAYSNFMIEDFLIRVMEKSR